MTLEHWFPLLFAALVLATATLSGVYGMAGGMILMALLAMLLPPVEAMVLHGLVQLASNGSRALLHLRHAAWRALPAYLAGALPVAALASLVRFAPDRGLVLLVLGGLPLAASLVPGLRLDFGRKPQAALCGAVVQAAQLVAGASGPILDVFFLRGEFTRREVVATKALTQSLGHALKLVHFALLLPEPEGGAAIPSALFVAGPLAALAGSWLGSLVLARLSESGFRRTSTWIVRAVGAACMTGGGMQLLAA